jgi:hypothetical protein
MFHRRSFVDLKATKVFQKPKENQNLVACWPACGNVIPIFKVIPNPIASIKTYIDICYSLLFFQILMQDGSRTWPQISIYGILPL